MTENDTIQLYHHHKSTCSQKVRICLAEKEILWTSRFVDISKEENLSAEYLAINPNGVVPAIKHLGRNIIESSVIVEYLDEVFESGYQLTPDDPIDRANMRAWLRYIDEVPSMAVRVPSYQLVLRKRFDAMSEGEYEAFINKNPLRNEFFSRMGRGGFNDEEYNQAIDRLKQTVSRMEVALTDQSWICGEEFGLVDICMIPTFQRLDDLELTDIWLASPKAASWFERARMRPSFDITYYPGAKFMDQDCLAPL